jgi:hypothetical protein
MRRALLMSPVLLLGAVVVLLVPMSWWGGQQAIKNMSLEQQIIAGLPTWDMLIPWNVVGYAAAMILVLGYPYIWLVLKIGQRLESGQRPPEDA